MNEWLKNGKKAGRRREDKEERKGRQGRKGGREDLHLASSSTMTVNSLSSRSLSSSLSDS